MKIRTILGASILLLVSGQANAATITTYDNRAAFDAAVGPTTLEDFNSQALGTSFLDVALDLGDFSVERETSGGADEGRMQVGFPCQFDGTICGEVTTRSSQDLVFTFLDPIFAFGLDVYALNDENVLRTLVEADGTNVPVTVEGDPTARFFGFSSDTAFTEVRFVGVVGDGWAFDNLAYASPPSVIPTPASTTPCRISNRITSLRSAPSAMRMPISWVRCWTV